MNLKRGLSTFGACLERLAASTSEKGDKGRCWCGVAGSEVEEETVIDGEGRVNEMFVNQLVLIRKQWCSVM